MDKEEMCVELSSGWLGRGQVFSTLEVPLTTTDGKELERYYVTAKGKEKIEESLGTVLLRETK